MYKLTTKQLIEKTQHVADNREREYQRQAEEDQKYGVDELAQSTDRQIEVLEYLLDHYKGDYK